MKSKTSLTLCEDLVARIDKLAGPNVSRSAYIEQILQEFLERRARGGKGVREIAAVNHPAAEFHSEISNTLCFQVNSTDE